MAALVGECCTPFALHSLRMTWFQIESNVVASRDRAAGNKRRKAESSATPCCLRRILSPIRIQTVLSRSGLIPFRDRARRPSNDIKTNLSLCWRNI